MQSLAAAANNYTMRDVKLNDAKDGVSLKSVAAAVKNVTGMRPH